MASAVAPSLLLLLWFHKRDVYPEPTRVVGATFGLGILTVIPVLIVVPPLLPLVALIPLPVVRGFAEAFFMAAIPEEMFKFAVLMLYVRRHAAFDEPMDGLVYGVAASLGFATLENILFVSEGGIGLAIMRGVTAVPAHAMCGALMGYFVGMARFKPAGQVSNYLLAICVPTLLHGFYNFPLLWANGYAGTTLPTMVVLSLLIVPAVLGGGILWAFLLNRKLYRMQREARLTASLPEPDISMPTVATTESGRPVMQNLAIAPPRSTAKRPGVALSWLLVVVGFLLVAIGGTITLGVMLALTTGTVAGDELIHTLIGTAIIGLFPAIGGVGLFIWGITRLNRDAAVAASVATLTMIH